MLTIRDYTEADGNLVASWVTDQWTLRVWAAACYPEWPVSGAQISELYVNCKEKEPSFRPLMAEEDGVPVAHMTVQYTDPEKTTVHFGFVVVDPACRGKGIGSRLLREAMALAYGEMGAEKVDLMVFTCNERAHKCYLNLGFRDVRESPMEIGGELWGRWIMEREKSNVI